MRIFSGAVYMVKVDAQMCTALIEWCLPVRYFLQRVMVVVWNIQLVIIKLNFQKGSLGCDDIMTFKVSNRHMKYAIQRELQCFISRKNVVQSNPSGSIDLMLKAHIITVVEIHSTFVPSLFPMTKTCCIEVVISKRFFRTRTCLASL